jgi:phosphatidylserine/phosphatidylglycerophosphate/cardiolipin synthase-like enzyme
MTGRKKNIRILKYVNLLLVAISISCTKNELSITRQSEYNESIPIDIQLPEMLSTNVESIASFGYSYTILDKIIELISATPDSSEIYISIFEFDYLKLFDALSEASKRGVKIHLLIDYKSDNVKDVNHTVVNKFSTITNGQIVLFSNDAGNTAINHNKFVLFSEIISTTDTLKNIIIQTSHNFTYSGAKKIQDAVILSEEGLYLAYLHFWNELKSRCENGMTYYNYAEYQTKDAKIKGCFFPKRKNGTFYGEDTIVELLDTLKNPSDAIIRIGMSLWTTSRKEIITKLGELSEKGAVVEVITKDSNSDELIIELNKLKSKGVWVKVYSKANIHSKFILIQDGQDNNPSKYVITGSHNFTKNALRYNAESILILNNNELYDQYLALYKNLKTLE